jgi:arabinoxylan arabinofuranohydrolase
MVTILESKKSNLLFARKSGNPIIRDLGICDPHIHIFDGKAWLYAGKDRSWHENWWVMDEWQIWNSSDLVNWEYQNTIHPENAYTGKNKHCWAGDCAHKDGKYYWYFSNHFTDTGVMRADSPAGDFHDALGKPLLPHDITPEGVHPYDPEIFVEDDGNHYIIFGTNTYHIARLNDDMISLAETPRPLEIDNPTGVCDKPGMFKRNGRYYLQWGGNYAWSENLYGPYEYKGTFSNGHAKVFIFHDQWYVGYVQRDALFHRSTYVSHLKFRDDGTVIPHGVDPFGVGQYDASRPFLDIEEFFQAKGVRSVDSHDGRDKDVVLHEPEGYLFFPKVKNIGQQATLYLRYSCADKNGFELSIFNGNMAGTPLFDGTIPSTDGNNQFTTHAIKLTVGLDQADLYLQFKHKGDKKIRLNWISFNPEAPEPIIPYRQWDFLVSHEGWTAGTDGKKQDVDHTPGKISGTATGATSIMPPNFVVTPLNSSDKLLFRMKIDGPPIQAKLSFCTIDENDIFNPENNWKPGNSIDVQMITHGKYQDYIFDMHSFADWNGRLKQLRLDLLPDTNEMYSWEISYIVIW